MRKNTPKYVLIGSALALAGALIVPASWAQADNAAKKSENSQVIRDYDTNGDGRLDRDEAAELQKDKQGGKGGKKHPGKKKKGKK
jgi:hypothetical protein